MPSIELPYVQRPEPPMKILIANPNTSQDMTDLMVLEGRKHCRAGTTVDGVCSDFGVPYIATRSEMAIAGYAILDKLASIYQDYDAVVLGAFVPVLTFGAKELLPLPVIGIAEAMMRAAQLFGRRVGIIGMGSYSRAENEEVVSTFGMQRDVCSIRLIRMSGTELAKNQDKAIEEIVKLGLAAVAEDHADVLVLGGGAFAGMAELVAPHLPVPVIPPIHYAVGLAELAVLSGWIPPKAGIYKTPGTRPTDGLNPALAKMFSQT